MERIDYNTIWTQQTENGKWVALKNEVARVGYVDITDVYTHLNSGGWMMLAYLDRQEQEGLRTRSEHRWKLRAICDEWGNEYKPGDVVVRKINKPFRDEAGHKLRSNAMNDMRRRGTFERDFVEVREFVVDEKGCIDCSYQDASHFISEFGVSYHDHSQALCGRRKETAEPCRAPDGSMRPIQYWRFYEVPPDEYDRMEPLNKPKQGYKKSSKDDAKEGVLNV